MIEVFKTNIIRESQATLLIHAVHQQFAGYIANFDLEDCDHILRVNCTTGPIDAKRLQSFLREHGCYAETLPDEVYSYPITPANAVSFISRFYYLA